MESFLAQVFARECVWLPSESWLRLPVLQLVGIVARLHVSSCHREARVDGTRSAFAIVLGRQTILLLVLVTVTFAGPGSWAQTETSSLTNPNSNKNKESFDVKNTCACVRVCVCRQIRQAHECNCLNLQVRNKWAFVVWFHTHTDLRTAPHPIQTHTQINVQCLSCFHSTAL